MQLHGVNITTTKILSEEMAITNNSSNIKDSSIKCLLISLILGVFASIIFVSNSSFIVNICLHRNVGKSVVYLISIALPMISISSSISGYYTASRKIYKSIIANFLEYIVKIIVTIQLLKIYIPTGKIENICFALILGDVISEVISFTYNIIVYTSDINKLSIKKILIKDSIFLRIIKILIPISLTSYIRSGLSTLKQLMIPSGLEKNGINYGNAISEYGTITGMAMPIIMFPATFLSAISSLLVPEFSRYYIKKDYIIIKKYTKKILLISLFFSIIITIIFILFGDILSIIIYHDITINKYIKIFAILVPFIYLDIVIDNILKGLNEQITVLIINIIDLVVSILFIFIFVPTFGIKGFIASIFVSEFINFTFSLYKLKKWNNSKLLF